MATPSITPCLGSEQQSSAGARRNVHAPGQHVVTANPAALQRALGGRDARRLEDLLLVLGDRDGGERDGGERDGGERDGGKRDGGECDCGECDCGDGDDTFLCFKLKFVLDGDDTFVSDIFLKRPVFL